MTILLPILTIATLVVSWSLYKRSNKACPEVIENAEQFSRAIADFNTLYGGARYVNYTLDLNWKDKYTYLYELLKNCSALHLPSEIKQLVNNFKVCFEIDQSARKKFNNEFVEKQKVSYKKRFDSLMKNPLTDQQRTAILHDEDNSLIIAGAGTGKTTTIMGKIAYLLENNLATKDEILLISFTKASVKDMQKDLRELELDTDLNVKTFNSLGNGIIGEVEDGMPELLFNGSPDANVKVKEFLNNVLLDSNLDTNIRVQLASFFLYYLYPEKDVRSFDTLDEYHNYVKSIKLLTFQGEIVKSFEELKIANFLYLNNVKYIYENAFDKNIRDPKFSLYKPDFYLPDNDVTIEHFGIDKNGRVPKFFNSGDGVDASQRYKDKMEFARKIHKEHGRTLIESYSYENKDGTLLPNLQQNLSNAGIKMKQRPVEEVLKNILVDKKFSPFIDLVYTFLTLAKSNHVSIDYLNKKAIEQKDKRASTFLQIFVYLYSEYEAFLQKEGVIDFNDMIIKSTEHIRSGRYQHFYKYVLVDEFQDMSVGRYDLLRSLLDQNPYTKLFCVGDDWQSIYRFTGSDISITIEFENYFGYTYRGKLESTHRFNNKILDYSSQFIQKNPAQIKKKLTTSHEVEQDYQALHINKYGNGTDKTVDSLLVEILDEIAQLDEVSDKKKPEVLLLGRYNHNKPKQFNSLTKKYDSRLTIDYKTAHKAKGLTYDYTVLIDVNAGTLGFPSEIVDDPLLQLVLRVGDDFNNAEERRVFYVALTRAKHKNYIISQKGNESKFVTELEKSRQEGSDSSSSKKCLVCDGGLIERTGPYSTFLGCANFPLCEYRLKL